MHISDTLAHGTPFWVSVPLVQGDVTPVQPPTARKITMTALSSAAHITNWRLVILGFHYDYVASAAAVGFALYFGDFQTGARLNRYIINPLSQAAGRVEGGAPDCFIEAPAGVFTSGTVKQPADLFLDVSGTAPTSGHLLIWGVLVEGDFARCATQTGSPFQYGG